MPTNVKRITVSLPCDLADDLDYCHKRVGVSKSAFVTYLLSSGVSDLAQLLRTLPDEPTPEDLIRFRGASTEMATNRMNRFFDQLGDKDAL